MHAVEHIAGAMPSNARFEVPVALDFIPKRIVQQSLRVRCARNAMALSQRNSVDRAHPPIPSSPHTISAYTLTQIT